MLFGGMTTLFSLPASFDLKCFPISEPVEKPHESEVDLTITTLREGREGRWEGVSPWGTHVHLWLIHVSVRQKPLQYCKVITSNGNK